MRLHLRHTLILTLLALTLTASRAFAWGNTGHEAIAYVAWQKMTPATRARALQLIALVPSRTVIDSAGKHHYIPGYADWVTDLPAGITPDQKNLYLFMRAATWADSIKHQGLADSDTPPPGNPATDSNIGFTDTHSHGYWHFVDNGFSSDGTTVPALKVPSAATQIVAFRTDIASNEPDLLKAYDMIWLEHIVGDVHQPLHAVARFSANDTGTDGDEGGNTVYIKLPVPMEHQFEAGSESHNAPKELHAFWDSLPGEGQPKDVVLAASFASTLSPAPAGPAANTTVDDWVAESFALAQSHAYVSPIGTTATPASAPYIITNAYYATAIADAKARIALAGARLANLLNNNLQ